MIIVEDEHFSMWKEFIERHHQRELINPDLGEMFKKKKPFTLSSKFQFTCEFLSPLATSPIMTSRCTFSIS